jgi:hypothetical protein
MNFDKYSDISVSSDFLDFAFVSTGVKGDFNKLVKFSEFSNSNGIYNLALGTVLYDGTIDFVTPSRNGDRDKILATIGAIAYVFSEEYPNKMIFLKGDTIVKTRLYQMAICKALDEINQTFSVYGLKVINDSYQDFPFEKGENYDAFLFSRK